MDGQTQIFLFSLTIFLLVVWILKEKVNLRKMAYSHDKSKLAVLSGVVAFIAVLNSIVFSWLSIVILDSIELDRVIGDSGMYAAIVFVPIIPSGLMSAIILGNRRWVYFASLLTLVIGLYLVLSCFYCFGGLSR